MLPSLRVSGMVTLIAATLLCLLKQDKFAVLMQTWLVAWAFAFPLAYLGKTLHSKFSV